MAKARTYKRDAIGRFAGGGAKDPRGPAKVGRAGPRGGKTGTRTQQKKAKQAQQSRTKQFQSKTQASSARDAYKAASRGARMSEKGAAKKVGRLMPKPVSGAKQALNAAMTRLKVDMAAARGEAERARARLAFKAVVKRAKREDPSSVMAPRRGKRPQTIRQAQQRLPKSALRNPKGNAKGAIATRLASRERLARFAIQSFGSYGNFGSTSQRQYERAQRSLRTAAKARRYLSTGKLPGRDNSMRAQREMRQAQARLTATNAARRAGRLPTPNTKPAAQRRRR